MDLNHLLFREGVERLRAAAAGCAAARAARLGLAGMYRDRIAFRRRVARDAAGLRPAPLAPAR